MKLFCSNYGQNFQITAAAYYFYYDYHDHYQYDIFHKHCKMHLHLPGFILIFPLDCNMIFHLPSLIPISFFTPSKTDSTFLYDQQTYICFFLYTSNYIYAILHLYFTYYSYCYYYYINWYRMWSIDTTVKRFSIEDDYSFIFVIYFFSAVSLQF